MCVCSLVLLLTVIVFVSLLLTQVDMLQKVRAALLLEVPGVLRSGKSAARRGWRLVAKNTSHEAELVLVDMFGKTPKTSAATIQQLVEATMCHGNGLFSLRRRALSDILNHLSFRFSCFAVLVEPYISSSTHHATKQLAAKTPSQLDVRDGSVLFSRVQVRCSGVVHFFTR